MKPQKKFPCEESYESEAEGRPGGIFRAQKGKHKEREKKKKKKKRFKRDSFCHFGKQREKKHTYTRNGRGRLGVLLRITTEGGGSFPLLKGGRTKGSQKRKIANEEKKIHQRKRSKKKQPLHRKKKGKKQSLEGGQNLPKEKEKEDFPRDSSSWSHPGGEGKGGDKCVNH